MNLSVQLGLVCALLCAFTSILGFLYKHRGAVEAPAVDFRRPIHSSVVLFSSRWYVIGILVAMGAWGFHVAALALAPISIVQTVIAGGLVFLTVAADRIFGFTVTRREWLGVGGTALGLALLAATLGGGADRDHQDFEYATLFVYTGAATVVSLGAWALSYRTPGRAATLFAVAAGLQWGASDVTIKALSNQVPDGVIAVLIDPLALIVLLLSLLGLLVSAKSLQLGKAVAVIAVTNAAANICTIVSGPVVFGEPLPSDPLSLGLRILAFALVIGSAAMTPPPVAEAHGDGGGPDPAPAPAGA